jgi:hypothetical protein
MIQDLHRETLDYFTQAVEKTVFRILRHHSRANGHPGFSGYCWILAFAGMMYFSACSTFSTGYTVSITGTVGFVL